MRLQRGRSCKAERCITAADAGRRGCLLRLTRRAYDALDVMPIHCVLFLHVLLLLRLGEVMAEATREQLAAAWRAELATTTIVNATPCEWRGSIAACSRIAHILLNPLLAAAELCRRL